MLPLEEQLARSWPPQQWADVTVLVAVSGGPDSVALLRAMHQIRLPGPGRMVVAHFDHGLRGEQGLADSRFVRALSARLDLECAAGRVEAGEVAMPASEEAARAARYQFLQRAAAEHGARLIATGHTADDQAETILHRIIRGTGLAGVAGIPRTRTLGPASLIRPMLHVRRAEVVEYLAELGQPYQVDSTNAETRFTRNRIRHELLPHLAEHYNPAVADALLRLGRLAGEAQAVIDRLADELLERNASPLGGGEVLLDARTLSVQPRYLIREVLLALWRRQGWPLQAMGFEQFEELAEMLLTAAHGRPVASRTFPGSVAVAGQEGELRFVRQ